MIKKLVIFLIKVYQKAKPKNARGRCRFVPSCSQYMIEAILKRGLIVGIALGIYRILRCNPFNKHCGLDKVPDKKSVIKWVY